MSSALQECDVKNIFDVGAFQGDTVSHCCPVNGTAVKLYQGEPLYHDIAIHMEELGYGLYDICKPRNDKCGQLAWADAVFCHNSLLDRIRKRNVPDVKEARETA